MLEHFLFPLVEKSLGSKNQEWGIHEPARIPVETSVFLIWSIVPVGPACFPRKKHWGESKCTEVNQFNLYISRILNFKHLVSPFSQINARMSNAETIQLCKVSVPQVQDISQQWRRKYFLQKVSSKFNWQSVLGGLERIKTVKSFETVEFYLDLFQETI